MKVGTDGVLLGAWADVEGCRHITDIGCGSGLIALMAAQRAPKAWVTGVEIDPESARDAMPTPLFDHFLKCIATKDKVYYKSIFGATP